MKSFILAQDDIKAPKRSALLVGPETPDEKVRAAFFGHKSNGYHPEGWAVLKYYGPTGGLEGASVARFKDDKDKAATLAREKATLEAEAKSNADKEAKRLDKIEKDKR
jgi:hypothetical protein